jgi:hypothetical protein
VSSLCGGVVDDDDDHDHDVGHDSDVDEPRLNMLNAFDSDLASHVYVHVCLLMSVGVERYYLQCPSETGCLEFETWPDTIAKAKTGIIFFPGRSLCARLNMSNLFYGYLHWMYTFML